MLTPAASYSIDSSKHDAAGVKRMAVEVRKLADSVSRGCNTLYSQNWRILAISGDIRIAA